MEKRCSKCKLFKSLESFSKNRTAKDGFQHRCKLCTEKYKNREVAIKSNKRWKENNKTHVLNYALKYIQNKRKNDKEFSFKGRVSNLVRTCFKNACKGKYKKGEKTENILGCSMEEFMSYLESLFTKGMNFKNHGMCEECWNIDHKIPISSAKTEEDIIKLCHYTNLQPMWSRENLSKGNKLI